MKTKRRTHTPRHLREVTAGAGWLTWATALQPEWTAVLLVLSSFVIVTLGLRLVQRREAGPKSPSLETLHSLAPLAAMSAAASFVPEAGTTAALLSAPWLVFTIAVAATGFGRLLSRKVLLDPGIGADAGLMFLAVGGAWLTISRAGLNPLGFSDAIVQLTAVHFHYAGFALPIVAGVTASRLGRSAAVPSAVILGVPLTAIGITTGGWTEWFAATTMALAGIATAAMVITYARSQHRATRWLLGTAGTALFAGMVLALGWAWSIRFGWEFLGLESMAATHGSLNALGFGLLGLVGLNMAPNTNNKTAASANVHIGRPSTERLEELRIDAATQATTNEIGLLARPLPAGFERKTWTRSVEHHDFAAAVDRIKNWSGHDAAGINRVPNRPRVTAGETLALAIPVGPISVSATCRIVEVFNDADRYGFTYSTLPHHPEDGEESFIVTQLSDGSVDVEVTAVWRAATLANHVCPPVTRFLQSRAIKKYLDGIATAA